MELEENVLEQVNEVAAKYAITSLEDAKAICEDKGLNISSIIKPIKNDINELAETIYTFGAAIAIKKDTKLASYVAIDIGEAIQAFCVPDSEGTENRAGLGHGYQASSYIKNNQTKEENATDYSTMLEFMGLSNDELLNITTAISNRVEEIMNA